MKISKYASRLALGLSMSASATAIATAMEFNVPGGDLEAALNAYSAQSGVQLMVSSEAVRGIRTRGIKGDLPSDVALSRILSGTGFVSAHDIGGGLTIVKGAGKSSSLDVQPLQLAQASPAPRASVETVTVTSSKLGGADVQSIPIAITALSQEQLTATQTAGGPDLVKQVPNLTFTKTNFTGYSINIRGIGTQAISVTTDPAVAVAFNDVPFIRNHFFEQEFFDLGQVEVLRGPQGTLYGRNATAGVVNLLPAKPTDQFEMMLSAEAGNYNNRRFEGMINIPVVDDRLDIRLAGEWTKRDGYSFNQLTNTSIDGRDLWSGRLTIGFKPVDNLQFSLVWERFSEDDDRLRSSKQLCKTAPTPTAIGNYQIPQAAGDYQSSAAYFSQGCELTSLYSPEAYEVPNGFSLPFILGLQSWVKSEIDPYSSTTQSTDLRSIESSLPAIYRAKNDTVEFNTNYQATPALSVTSQTAFSHDFLYSTQDFNRFNTTPGIWDGSIANQTRPRLIDSHGQFCDPQLGCSSRLVAQDLSEEHAWQLNQEFRLASNFSGPVNFNLGGNYMHYETEENYYVFINALTLLANNPLFSPPGGLSPWIPNVTDNLEYLHGTTRPDPFVSQGTLEIGYIDPNRLATVNGQGHNYFLSQNPYKLESYAAFGEFNYSIVSDLKVTLGLRWTEDQKHFVQLPSEVLVGKYGYPSTGVLDQQWDQLTGRSVVNWTPRLDFTDQTLVYASYSHGYKAGGANPPAAILTSRVSGNISNPVHPLSFKPEFVDAFELGSKNTLMDSALTVNVSAFYYNYENYQISEIVDRTAINLNFDTHVKGAEVEASWEPVPGLRFNFAGGWEDTSLARGSQSVDLMDRTAGRSDWLVVKPFPNQASNCVLPDYVAVAALEAGTGTGQYATISLACGISYASGHDPLTNLTYVANPTVSSYLLGLPAGYAGFDPLAGTAGDPYHGQNTSGGHDYGPAPNNGVGFWKDLSGNELPNAPPFTLSLGAQYTIPFSSNWAGTLRGDFYWQDSSWARVFNDEPYDRLHGYTNLNLTLILTSQSGWQVMLYDKNVFNTTAITGDFLNSDDTGLTTNIFLTDPRLFGIRLTKNW